MKLGLLHFSGPPIVGGVEQTLYHQAMTLAELEHQPFLLIGEGAAFDPRIPVRLIPQLFSRHPEVLAVKAQLDAGQISSDYQRLRQRLAELVLEAVQGLERLIVHNALTLHKNLALTAALHELHRRGSLPALIGWHHDFAWEREGYRHELHAGEPWELLSRPWPGVCNVVVSSAQRRRLASLYSIPEQGIHVVPPGIDLAVAGGWTQQVCKLARELNLLEAEILLLLPARLTRRKNIEFALQVLAALRARSGADARLLVTGPPGPHNPQNQAYLQELLALRQQLQLDQSAHFLYLLEQPDLDQQSIASLYSLSDALFFPSRDEGFGIPILEAGYARLPIFCSDIPPFRESSQGRAHFFSLQAAPSDVAELVEASLREDPAFAFRSRVRRQYGWREIVEKRLLPLLDVHEHERT